MKNIHKERAENTEKLLKLVSSHLSSRKECRGLTYSLDISTTWERGYVLNVDIGVFPGHHRKPVYKMSLMQHILKYHMPDVAIEDKDGFRLNLDKVLCGSYKYSKQLNRHCRKWDTFLYS